MEIAPEKLLQKSEIKQAQLLVQEQCLKAAHELACREAADTAKAVQYCALSSAAKGLADTLALEAGAETANILARYLKTAQDHPEIMRTVRAKAEQAARKAAIEAVRAWSKERSLPAAEKAAQTLLEKSILDCSQKEASVSICEALGNFITLQEESDAALRQKAIEGFLAGEAENAANTACQRAFNVELRRKAQKTAEDAAAAIASEAGEDVAREAALSAARQIAEESVQTEILHLIARELQHRVTNATVAFLEKEIGNIEFDAQKQFCQENTERIAKEICERLLDEITNRPAFASQEKQLFELANSAASSAANHVIDNLGQQQQQPESKGMSLGLFIGIQTIVGALLIWLFLFGGGAQIAEASRPLLQSLLPPKLYRQIYPPPVDQENELSPINEDVMINQTEPAAGNTPPQAEHD